MKLKKEFNISESVFIQTPMYIISDTELLQWFSFSSESQKKNSNAQNQPFCNGLLKINLEDKHVEQLSEKKVSLLHAQQEYCYFLEEWYENGAEVASIKRLDYDTKKLTSSALMPELYGSLEGNRRLHVIGNLFYLNNYTQFYVFNSSLECIYKYKTWRSLDNVICWNNQIMYSTESDGCRNSVLVKHFLTEERCASYSIETFFQKTDKGNALNCFKTAEKYLLIEVDSIPRKLVIIDENANIVFQLEEYAGKVYFAHPFRKEILFFEMKRENGDAAYVYKNWETGEILWELMLTESFDVNWYNRYPYFWEKRDKFIFDGFQNGKNGIWVIDILTFEKEFFKPIGGFNRVGFGGIVFKDDCAYINTVSGTNRNYYYKLMDC